ncbi:MAG: hypothetical protein Q8O25_11120, partial [Sulfurisoma sp.]|nr:hypothetical protein [Sulfurisoma sp.]
MMTITRFNDALRLAAQAAQDPELPKDWPVRVVRDVYGRVRFAIDCEANQYPAAARERLEIALARLGAYATKGEVIFKDDLSNPDAIFKGPDWHLTTVPAGFDEEDQAKPDLTVSVLDRQIMGQDWLNPIAAPAPHPHRIVFSGVKGGVGRSTALA